MSQPLLNILITHIPERYYFLRRLNEKLDPQIEKFKGQVSVLIDDSRYKKIGRKRNDLLARATAKYTCFFDDDDLPSDKYVELMLEGCRRDVDCVEFVGIITDNGQNPRKFIHSLKYDSWFEKDSVYYRPPNHLSCIRASIAKKFKFPEINHGEDHDWSMQIQKSGLLKTQHDVNEVLYYYECRDDEQERKDLEALKNIYPIQEK
jgi:hypothetical protein